MKSKIFKYIYAMLCLLPAFAVGVTCVYVANNENAYQSYSGYNLETNTELATDIESGLNYQFSSYAYNGTTSWSTSVLVDDLFLSTSYSGLQSYFDANKDNIKYIRLIYNSVPRIHFYNANNTQIEQYVLNTNNNYFVSFTAKSNATLTDNDLLYLVYQQQVGNSLDNVFYYSLDKVENSNVFSWVKSNFLYDGMNSFVGIFGGTNSNISFYLTWVLTISLCYLGFEVLMLFINMARNLIHSFTDKDRW